MVVYTVLIGNFDKLQPALFSDKVRYICFSDRPVTVSGWEYKHIEKQFGDNRRNSRYPKIRPDIFLPDYKISLYHDASFQLLVDPISLCNQYLVENNIALFQHPERDCLYKEAETCKSMGLDKDERFENQVKSYRQGGMPQHWGLFHAGSILRRHLELDIVQFSKLWWHEYTHNSCRDQISLPYALWKTNTQYITILENPYQCSYFTYKQHKG